MPVYNTYNTDMLMTLSKDIAPFVRVLLNDGRAGISAGMFKILDLKSSVSNDNKSRCDRFKICIPHAGQTLTWEVLFDCNYPDEPPDFIFGPEDEDFYPSLEDVKSLLNWDSTDHASLLHVVIELLQLYQDYQQKLVLSNSRLKFEYSSLMDNQYPADRIELLAYKKADSLGPVHFLIDLGVDFSCIPAYLTKDNPGEDSAMLLITFSSADRGKVTPQLYLSPRVSRCLSTTENVRIPTYLAGSCLLDYVPAVKELLENKIEQILTTYVKRKEYIASFLSYFGRSIIQYDAEGFTKISFLFEWNDFFFITLINLPIDFPQRQPEIRIQSVYHIQETNTRPFNRIYCDYPYSPRWNCIEMCERARSFILENIKDFQIASVKKGRF